MAERFEDQPPTYSQVEREDAAAVAATAATIVSHHQTGVTPQNTGYLDNELNQANRHATRFSGEIGNNRAVSSEGTQETTDNNNNMGNYHINASNSFSGFIGILHENKKLPWSSRKNMMYRVGLLAYYFANFMYSIVATAIQGEHVVYHLVYIFISLFGFAVQLTVMIFSSSRHENEETATSTLDKAKRVLIDYITFSLGEFLIYPILICTLYGFINERAWRFDSGILQSNFIFFAYSVIMDAMYLKTYVIFLVIRILFSAYKKYDDLPSHTDSERKNYYSCVSFYWTIVLAMLTALTHWIMLGIIGVRVYVDNFTPDKDDAIILNTGDYKVAPLTGYMIACPIYLPMVSWITYIILNKLWFCEVYSAINQLSNGADHMPQRNIYLKRLLAFVKDPLAYIAVAYLIAPFVIFIVAAYLPDYDSSDYEVSSSARNAIQGLRTCFIITFLFSNLQVTVIILTVAVAVTMILLVVVVAVLLFGIPVMCVVVFSPEHKWTLYKATMY